MASAIEDQIASDQAPGRGIPAFAYASLFVLTLANILNYLDRQILSILAESIKADLKLDDAQLGFLMGTAFAVFYAVVGIAMGRISDGVSRKRLMALGLTLWSAMTALGGAASSFATLSFARIGVGVGEATASPCAQSLLADTFPSRNRAIVLGIYLSGAFIGNALALFIGGYFVQHWQDICTAIPVSGACGVANWQAALFAVGALGLPVVLLLLMLREPRRAHARPEKVGRFVATEFGAALPPFTLMTIHRLGGSAALMSNLVVAIIAIVLAVGMIWLTGDYAQWIAAGIGLYAVITWAHVQKHLDRPLYAVTFGDTTFLLAMIGSALVACIGGAATAWAAPYAIRTLGMSPAETGLSLGLVTGGAAIIGVTLGGWLTDRWKPRDRAAPLWMAMIAVLGGLPTMAVMMTADDVRTFLIGAFAYSLITSTWSGAFAALIQDLVLPRMRGAAAAAFALFSIVVASGLGPYWAGKVSVITKSLQTGVLSMQLLLPIALVLLLITVRRLRKETPETRRRLAEAAGEPPLA